MKKLYTSLFFSLAFASGVKAQKIDSIYFNLYTDSLKKGSLHFNYISVDGKLPDGSYIPLDSTHVRFTASVGKITGNVLTLDSAVKEPYVVISATLIGNPAVRKEMKIYIKQIYTEEPLKSAAELIEGWQRKNRTSKNQR